MPDTKTSSSNEKTKYVLFWGITISFPILILLLIELALRVGGYNAEKQNLFKQIETKPEYIAANPDFVGRYFTHFTPQVAATAFLKEKPANTYRIFVFGGSSTQGFPYNFYYAFAQRLEQRLLMETVGKDIEVINLGMTAVNSYVFWDLKERVMEYDPDAIVVYAGHNEYYGSFGVGSAQFGVGKSVALKRLIISLKNIRLYQFFEDLMRPEKDDNPENRTLMARVVAESNIELDGDIYQAGLRQFETNMTDVINYFADNDVPVYMGTVASKLKDQPPLGTNEAAVYSYKLGEEYLSEEKYDSAYAAFEVSKELDEVRFRAPKAINEIIEKLSEDKPNVVLVDSEKKLIEESASHIPDEELFTDHLHPTWEGHQYIADAFFEKLIETSVLNNYYEPNALYGEPKISLLEETFSIIPIVRLTVGYPFVKGLTPKQEMDAFMNIYNDYLHRSPVDSLAARAWREARPVSLVLTDALNELHRQNDLEGVARHYMDLTYWQIFNQNLLRKGIGYTLNERELDEHTALMLHVILTKKPDDPFFASSLAAIYLLQQDLKRAGYWLRESEKLDPNAKELLYNYARFHVMAGDTAQAQQYFEKYREVTRQQ